MERALRVPAAGGWLGGRFLPLVGAGAAGGDREEQFGAWRTFLAGIAATRPAVIVSKYIYGGAEALRAFLGSLAATPPEARLLVLMTSRPTIDELHPSFT